MPKQLDGRGKTREREGQITRDMVIPGVTTIAVKIARERDCKTRLVSEACEFVIGHGSKSSYSQDPATAAEKDPMRTWMLIWMLKEQTTVVKL